MAIAAIRRKSIGTEIINVQLLNATHLRKYFLIQ